MSEPVGLIQQGSRLGSGETEDGSLGLLEGAGGIERDRTGLPDRRWSRPARAPTATRKGLSGPTGVTGELWRERRRREPCRDGREPSRRFHGDESLGVVSHRHLLVLRAGGSDTERHEGTGAERRTAPWNAGVPRRRTLSGVGRKAGTRPREQAAKEVETSQAERTGLDARVSGPRHACRWKGEEPQEGSRGASLDESVPRRLEGEPKLMEGIEGESPRSCRARQTAWSWKTTRRES